MKKAHRQVCFFWAAMLALFLLPPEVTSILFFIYVSTAFMKGQIASGDKAMVAAIPLLALLPLGMINCYVYPFSDIVKDIWYFSLPSIFFLAGWAMASGWSPQELKVNWAYFGTVVSILFLVHAGWIFATGTASFANAYEMRVALGAGEITSVWGLLAVGSLLIHSRLQGGRKGALIVAAIANLAAMVLPESRTSLVFLFSGIFLVFIPAHMGKKRGMYWIALSIGSLSLVILLLALGPGNEATALGRLQNMFWEQFSFSFADFGDVNSRYRAFEALAAIRTYMEGSVWSQISGNGFGKSVDLGMLLNLGGPGAVSEYQFVPVLHNGYLFLLVKTGLIGFLLYIVFLVRTFRSIVMAKAEAATRFWREIGLVVVISTFLGTLVVSGPFNKGGFFTTSLLMGMALRQVFAPATRRTYPIRS